MLKLNLPSYDVKVKKIDGKLAIFDNLRRKFVALTPEEWVRQHFVHYLVHEKGYPPSLIANEIQINLNNQKKRCDTIVYDKTPEPVIIIEYKSPDIAITQQVFDQIVRYNIVLRVKYLIVSNGLSHYCCRMDYETLSFEYLLDIPYYTDL